MKKHFAVLLLTASFSLSVHAETKVENAADSAAKSAASCEPHCVNRMPVVSNFRLKADEFYPDPSKMKLSECPEGKEWLQVEGTPYYQCAKAEEVPEKKRAWKAPAPAED